MLKRLLTFLGRIGWAELIYGQVKDEGRSLYLARLPLTPMTRWGQLLWHVFYRGDEDPDPHDHPWDFWTMPLGQGYWEEVLQNDGTTRMNRVRPWTWQFRSWAYTHRVLYPEFGHLGSYDGYTDNIGSVMNLIEPARAKQACWPLHTLVWRKPYNGRTWGFWVLGNNPILERIGWYYQSNPCVNNMADRSQDRMKVPFRTYIYGEKQTDFI